MTTCFCTIFFFVISLIFLCFHSHFNVCEAVETKEDYEMKFSFNEKTGKGPSRWGQLDPSWHRCGNGTRQSPIDISRVQHRTHQGHLQMKYKPAPATLNNRGHDILVKWNGEAGRITINGTEYNLLHCHWHTPSEHKFNGVRFAMELHLVHENSIGELAVVGILYKYGPPDPFLSRLYRQIKSLQNKSGEIHLGIVNPDNIECGTRRKYYRYNGSLTTPPCHEGVIWTVSQQVQTVSLKQVRALKEAVHDGFEENARPTQPLNGRPVYLHVPHI